MKATNAMAIIGCFALAWTAPVIDARAAHEVNWVAGPGGAFSISATEVTVAQYRACVTAGACDVSEVGERCNYHAEGREDHPVNCASYHAAEAFCAFAGGRVCREEEWLAACRGDDDRTFPYGAEFDLAACNVQSQTETIEGRERGTVPVGSQWRCEGGLVGLFDMAGNVAEWVDPCRDDYCKFRGAGYLTNDPVDLFAACKEACSGNTKALKSGSVGIRCCRDGAE